MNQYGRVETVYDLGSFDFAIFEDEANLRFYPEKFEVNDYDLSFVTHSISDFTSGIGTTHSVILLKLSCIIVMFLVVLPQLLQLFQQITDLQNS